MIPSAAQSKIDPQVRTLSALIRLEQRIRACELVELRFVAVNETLALCPYQQSVLWESASGDAAHGGITAASGVSQPASDSPYIDFIKQLLRALSPTLDAPQVLTLDTIRDHAHLLEGWRQWLPAQLFWQPLKHSGSAWRGGLLLMRDQPWSEGEKNLLGLAADAFMYQFYQLQRQKAPPVWKTCWLKLRTRRALYAAIAICLIPMRNSVLAPAEVIAQSPTLIRAPIDGVIATIAVQPNQAVKTGKLLLSYDKAEFTTKLEVAQKTEQVAELELSQTTEAAMNDAEARNAMATARGHLEQAKADVAYYADLLSRADVIASQDGVVVFEDVYDWLGRPTNIGERIMMLADPSRTQLEISLPANEWMSFPDQASVSFFSNAAPYAPDHANLYYMSYRSAETPEGTVVYRLRASWSGNNVLRLGQKGSAVVYGSWRPLIWHALRKPLALARQWIGW